MARSGISNNFHVELPVRHPLLSFEEYHFAIPHPEIEVRIRIYTGLFFSSILGYLLVR
ncbi:hypothetical protein Sps_04063 [Shewanella psychrophila]|uniref:Uncharacterized protein n=1 Tax=Shewanella psychrophila TaxID=225848 RepID=A0A1S6HUT2_9GAMM|nr:hypothetical protein Sps_04063 [Shewanella psychrophila]